MFYFPGSRTWALHPDLAHVWRGTNPGPSFTIIQGTLAEKWSRSHVAATQTGTLIQGDTFSSGTLTLCAMMLAPPNSQILLLEECTDYF